VNSFL